MPSRRRLAVYVLTMILKCIPSLYAVINSVWSSFQFSIFYKI
ncbi:BnaC07g31510D [Brassica napus]|uniref:BnaC07g31510D protein n=1 Tax=Brassica napus TaxID=3708 RepID=A0A078GCG7_BRANA|nr:BnaC07g31510D [Brassica napus]